MANTLQQLIDQGPLPHPEKELWPDINPYQQQWIEDAHGKAAIEKLLALGSIEERKAELLRLDEAKFQRSNSENGAQDKETLRSLYTLAARYTEFGKFDDAEKIYNELLAVHANTPDGGLERLQISYGMAHLRSEQGRYAESEQLHREALPLVSQPPLGVDSMQYLGSWRAIIEAIARQPGRWREANEMLETGYELVAKMKGGRFEKFQEEEREAMDEVRSTVLSLKPEDNTADIAKL